MRNYYLSGKKYECLQGYRGPITFHSTNKSVSEIVPS